MMMLAWRGSPGTLMQKAAWHDDSEAEFFFEEEHREVDSAKAKIIAARFTLAVRSSMGCTGSKQADTGWRSPNLAGLLAEELAGGAWDGAPDHPCHPPGAGAAALD